MNRQQGFSLVESLIALVILSVGLISVAAMQLKALQSALSGYQHALANVAAVDAQERVWAAFAGSKACSDIPLSDVESAWKNHWFTHPETAVLTQADASRSQLSGLGCQFTITVYLLTAANDDGVELVYNFSLPAQS